MFSRYTFYCLNVSSFSFFIIFKRFYLRFPYIIFLYFIYRCI
nr:MAG TPA: hypothetical protein [Bacteriophage sp.]